MAGRVLVIRIDFSIVGLQRLVVTLNVFSELRKTQLHGLFILKSFFNRLYYKLDSMKTIIKIIFLSLILMITSCGSSKNRKCNGKKAIQTSMGKM